MHTMHSVRAGQSTHFDGGLDVLASQAGARGMSWMFSFMPLVISELVSAVVARYLDVWIKPVSHVLTMAICSFLQH
jgi:hypothetical protein